MADQVRVHVVIEGRVQGVFFRASTRDEARARGLTGWARNLPDGRVEAVFEGDKRVVENMLAWCHKGPPYAYVAGWRWSGSPTSGTWRTFGSCIEFAGLKWRKPVWLV